MRRRRGDRVERDLRGHRRELLGWSVADAELTSTGSATSGDWEAHAMEAGLVTVGYAGGCLWTGATGAKR